MSSLDVDVINAFADAIKELVSGDILEGLGGSLGEGGSLGDAPEETPPGEGPEGGVGTQAKDGDDAGNGGEGDATPEVDLGGSLGGDLNFDGIRGLFDNFELGGSLGEGSFGGSDNAGE